MLCDPFGGQGPQLGTLGLDVTNCWFAFLYVKILNLTFASRKLIFFAIRLHFFCSPNPTNKILKKTSLDLSSFLGLNFDGRPITFQIH